MSASVDILIMVTDDCHRLAMSRPKTIQIPDMADIVFKYGVDEERHHVDIFLCG